jgi:RimJ/RimL family protein N-acetyltransferase
VVALRAYTDEDLWLAEALEMDAAVMEQLGGALPRAAVHDAHRRRLQDPWWFAITADGEDAVGTIGIWETSHGGETLFETGWMVLPRVQGRGIASAALGLLIERVRAEPRFPSMHAFPPVTNAPSNALCRRAGFELVDVAEFVYQGRTLRCNHFALETPTP